MMEWGLNLKKPARRHFFLELQNTEELITDLELQYQDPSEEDVLVELWEDGLEG